MPDLSTCLVRASLALLSSRPSVVVVVRRSLATEWFRSSGPSRSLSSLSASASVRSPPLVDRARLDREVLPVSPAPLAHCARVDSLTFVFLSAVRCVGVVECVCSASVSQSVCLSAPFLCLCRPACFSLRPLRSEKFLW